MRQFIIDFHENIINFFTQTHAGSKDKLTRALPLLTLVLFVYGVNTMMMNGQAYGRLEQRKAAIISETMESALDEAVLIYPGYSYESTSGAIDSQRVYGKNTAYRFYFNRENIDDYYVFDEASYRWISEEPSIPPAVAKAFIHHDIGLVEAYDSSGIATVDGESYSVEYTLGLRVNIEDTFIYNPLPPLPKRVETFVTNQLGTPLDSLELSASVMQDDTETIYFLMGDDTMQLTIKTDESATLGTVTFPEEQ